MNWIDRLLGRKPEPVAAPEPEKEEDEISVGYTFIENEGVTLALEVTCHSKKTGMQVAPTLAFPIDYAVRVFAEGGAALRNLKPGEFQYWEKAFIEQEGFTDWTLVEHLLDRNNIDKTKTESSRRLERAVERVVEALEIKGANPSYHDKQWARLAREWPELHIALRNLKTAKVLNSHV